MVSVFKRLPLRENLAFFAQARRLYLSGVLLYVLKKSAEAIEFTVVVPKKISTKATERNKLKRRLRAAFKEGFVGYQGKPFQVVIVAQTKTKECSYQELVAEFTGFARKMT